MRFIIFTIFLSFIIFANGMVKVKPRNTTNVFVFYPEKELTCNVPSWCPSKCNEVQNLKKAKAMKRLCIDYCVCTVVN